MRKLKTFEQYNSTVETELVNEGLSDLFNRFSDKVKNILQTILEKMGAENVAELKEELQAFKGLTFKEIKNVLKSKFSGAESEPAMENVTNEGATETIGKIFGFGGIGIFLTAWFTMQNQWGFLQNTFTDTNTFGQIGLAAMGIGALIWLDDNFGIGSLSTGR